MKQTHKINAQTHPDAELTLGHNTMFGHSVSIPDGAAHLTIHQGHDLARARLVKASFNAFNQAGRALGIDAAELAESINLVAIFDALEHSLVYLEAQHKAGLLNDPSGQLALGQTRAQLSKLPKPQSVTSSKGV